MISFHVNLVDICSTFAAYVKAAHPDVATRVLRYAQLSDSDVLSKASVTTPTCPIEGTDDFTHRIGLSVEDERTGSATLCVYCVDGCTHNPGFHKMQKTVYDTQDPRYNGGEYGVEQT